MQRTIETELIINAPITTVWRELTNLAAYEDWNPFIIEAKGEIALNEKLYCRPRLPGSSRTMAFEPTIIRFEKEKEFAWLGGVILNTAIAGGEHEFRLEKIDENRVRLIHNEYFLGITSPLVIAIVGKRTKQGFELMNQALKERAEKCLERTT